MLFNSLQFVIFLPIVFIIYWAISDKYRWVLLLIASYYFYMSWNPKYVVLIFTTTFVSYMAGILLEKFANIKIRKLILLITLLVCLGILFFYKYFNFISQSVADVLGIFSIKLNPLTLNVLLPVGISFYTFQTLSYVIDVYKGVVKAERHFGIYATFISFFPQLVAGPIERTSNLLPQIKSKKVFDYDQATYGLKLMAWGYFKKLVIADNLSQYVSKVYDAPQSYTGFALVLATVFFTLQIYCDFSGYSDIAIGTAKILGVNLMTNFKSPYFSQSVKEFWSRWHISLSTWFRDYVYIPLGGNRVGKVRYAINLMITFLVSGLWHGANWTFVIWGGVHGVAQIVENAVIHKKYQKSKGIVWWLRVLTIFAFAAFAWIFFVSNSFEDAIYVVSNLLKGFNSPVAYLHDGFANIGLGKVELLYLSVSLLLLFVYDYFALRKDVINAISSKSTIVRWMVYCLFIIWIIMNVPIGNSAEFIYFQF